MKRKKIKAKKGHPTVPTLLQRAKFGLFFALIHFSLQLYTVCLCTICIHMYENLSHQQNCTINVDNGNAEINIAYPKLAKS
jgi:hypothetical protein